MTAEDGAEQDALHQQMTQETALLQETSKETEMRSQVLLKQINTSYKELSNKYETGVLAETQQVETFQLERAKQIQSRLMCKR